MKKGVFVGVIIMMMVSLFTLAIGLTEAQALMPDLKIASLTVQDSTAAGSKIFITDVTKNRGAGDAGASFTNYYLSSSPTSLAGATKLARRYVPPLAAGAKNTGSAYVEIPVVDSGLWYIIARADALNYVTESREGNNKLSKAIVIYSSTNRPDLTINSLTAPDSAGPGDVISITDTTKNGDTAGGVLQTVTVFYLSKGDATVDAGDVILGNRIIPALSTGASSTGATNVTIPLGTALDDDYYIIAVADAANIVVESNETNNAMSRAITIAEP